MTRVFIIRLLSMIPILFIVGTVAFFLNELSTVDQTEILLGGSATDDQRAALRSELGLDRSALERYFDWGGNVLRGDLGVSLYNGIPVRDSIFARLPVTLSYTLGGMLVAIAIGVPLGVFAGLKAGRPADQVASSLATMGLAIPNFWLGLVLAIIFGVNLGWLPAVGYNRFSDGIFDWGKSILMPSAALGLTAAGSIARQTRSAMIGVLQQEYIRTALAKGLPRRSVVYKHALRNASIPIVTTIAYLASAMLGGSIIVERVFAAPGLGSMAVDAILRSDSNAILGFVLVTVVIIVSINLLLDIAYAWLNPKVHTK